MSTTNMMRAGLLVAALALQAATQTPAEAHAALPPVELAGRAETVRRYASDARQGVAVGLVAAGGCAIGMYAMGGAAVASRVAVGGAAAAPVSVGANADAGLVITEATKMQDVAAYLTANCPGLCPALRWLLSLGAA